MSETSETTYPSEYDLPRRVGDFIFRPENNKYFLEANNSLIEGGFVQEFSLEDGMKAYMVNLVNLKKSDFVTNQDNTNSLTVYMRDTIVHLGLELAPGLHNVKSQIELEPSKVKKVEHFLHLGRSMSDFIEGLDSYNGNADSELAEYFGADREALTTPVEWYKWQVEKKLKERDKLSEMRKKYGLADDD